MAYHRIHSLSPYVDPGGRFQFNRFPTLSAIGDIMLLALPLLFAAHRIQYAGASYKSIEDLPLVWVDSAMAMFLVCERVTDQG